MTRAEYFAKQRELSGAILRAEQEAARRIRAATRELVLPLVKQYAEQGMITYPTEELARRIDHIIREEAAKPVAAARKLQDDMEASIAEKLGVKLHHRPEPQENARQRRLKNAKEPVGTIIKTPGRGWGYGTSGLAAYHRDPQTGKVVWDDLPLEYQFRKRADLSEQVWKAVEEQEQMVFDVIRGGRAAGRNVRDICKDLEEFINYPDGGARVVGRWGKMFPATKEGIRDAYMHQYVEGLGMQWGSPGAHNILYEKTPGGATRLREGFRQYLDERMSGIRYDEKTGLALRGSILPDAVKQYAKRLGKAGLDYRAIRIARTENVAMVAMEQEEIAANSDICTGEMDFVMERGRDAWPCNCEHYAQQNPWKVDDPERPEIPVHPGCVCEWRPRLKTDAEILAALKEEMAEDLATIEGTDEQKDLLEQIDEAEREGEPIKLRRDDPAIAKAMEIEDTIRKYSNEAAYIVDQNGKVVYEHPWGGKRGVNINRNFIKDNVVTHNHISGSTFGEDDITIFAKYNALEFRACTSSNVNFSIRRGEGDIDRTIGDDYNLAMKRITNEATFEAFGHGKAGEEYNTIKNNIIKEKANKWLLLNAQKYGYIYTVENLRR